MTLSAGPPDPRGRHLPPLGSGRKVQAPTASSPAPLRSLPEFHPGCVSPPTWGPARYNRLVWVTPNLQRAVGGRGDGPLSPSPREESRPWTRSQRGPWGPQWAGRGTLSWLASYTEGSDRPPSLTPGPQVGLSLLRRPSGDGPRGEAQPGPDRTSEAGRRRRTSVTATPRRRRPGAPWRPARVRVPARRRGAPPCSSGPRPALAPEEEAGERPPRGPHLTISPDPRSLLFTRKQSLDVCLDVGRPDLGPDLPSRAGPRGGHTCTCSGPKSDDPTPRPESPRGPPLFSRVTGGPPGTAPTNRNTRTQKTERHKTHAVCRSSGPRGVRRRREGGDQGPVPTLRREARNKNVPPWHPAR